MELDQIKILEQIGLTESEAKIYLANLGLGPASIIEIGQKAGITRQMVYNLVPGMIEQGLLKEVHKGVKRQIEAISPEVLRSRTEQISSQIDELIPELKSRQAGNSAVPLITVYENPIAMREWYDHFMNKAKRGEEFLVWSAGKDWYEMDKRYIDRFLRVKEMKRMKNLVICRDNADSRKLMGEINPQGSIKYRFATDAWSSNVDKWIWQDEVCILTMREGATNMIVIKSADYAALERFDFYRIWERINNQIDEIKK